MRIRNGIKAALVAGGLVVAAATPALATTVSIGGGTWSYAVGANYVYSNYYHADRVHRSSVHGAYWAYSGCTEVQVWAKAEAEVALWGNEAYWASECN